MDGRFERACVTTCFYIALLRFCWCSSELLRCYGVCSYSSSHRVSRDELFRFLRLSPLIKPPLPRPSREATRAGARLSRNLPPLGGGGGGGSSCPLRSLRWAKRLSDLWWHPHPPRLSPPRYPPWALHCYAYHCYWPLILGSWCVVVYTMHKSVFSSLTILCCPRIQ